MSSAGQDPSPVVSARVVNINLANWTVDVVTTFDRHYYRDIQVSAHYLHYNNGEGFYVMPDIGATCMVTIPGDSTPMFVSGFLAPMTSADAGNQPEGETTDAVTTDFFGDESLDSGEVTGTDAPGGTRSRGATPAYPNVDARFDAGRASAQAGTQYWRGRDGNFVILHRGGVLQIGASELAQRVYLPLDKILDVTKEYEHQNIGGGIRWGIQDGPPSDNPALRHAQTYRVFANDKYADVRVVFGKVNELGEPDGDSGEQDSVEQIGLGKDAPTICEVCVAAGGFKNGGDPANSGVRNSTTLRFMFDRSGKMLLRAAGKAVFSFFDDLTIKTKNNLNLVAKFINVQSEGGLDFSGKYVALNGESIRLGGGSNPMARMGDSVQVMVTTAAVTGTLSGNPFVGTITLGQALNGVITGGNPNIRGLHGRQFHICRSSWRSPLEPCGDRHSECRCHDIPAYSADICTDFWRIWSRAIEGRPHGAAKRTSGYHCCFRRPFGATQIGDPGNSRCARSATSIAIATAPAYIRTGISVAGCSCGA